VKKMRSFKKISGIIFGTIFLGLGVSLYKLSSLGQDPLSAMVFSIMYLINNEYLGYMFFYLVINLIFFLLMLIFLRKEIHIGTIINLLLTGFFSDLFLKLFLYLNMDTSYLIFKIVYGLLGLIIASFGIALYGGARVGIAPYDSLPLILKLRFKKISYRFARIIIDLLCTIIALIIGVLILKRSDIINFNTILTFLAMGPIISFFGKIIGKYIYKKEEQPFN
jgi:putative membrane protein (fragment)